MKKEKLIAALNEWMATDEFERRIGGILQKIVDAKLDYEMEVYEAVDAAKEGKAPAVVKKDMNVLHFMATYMPRHEGRMLGLQQQVREEGARIAGVGRRIIEIATERKQQIGNKDEN